MNNSLITTNYSDLTFLYELNLTKDNDSIVMLNGTSLTDQKNVNITRLIFIILTSLILTTIIISTVIGNILVIAAVLIERNLRTPANYLVLSLAVADFLVACLVMPLGAFYQVTQQWSLGNLWCEIWTTVDVLCCTASILHLLVIAVDRYWAVTNVDYIHQRTAFRIGIMILIVWFVSAIISLAPNFGWKDTEFKSRIEVEKRCLVSQNMGYQIFATVATFYGPLVLILALYWKIYQVARKRIRKKPGSKLASNSQSAQPIILTSPSGETISLLTSNQNTILSKDSPILSKDSTLIQSELNNLKIKPQQLQLSTISTSDRSTSDKSTSTTCTDNHSPPPQQICEKPILLRSKSYQKRSINSKKERKAAKTLAIVTGVFVICWLPFFVVALLMPLIQSFRPSHIWLSIFLWLGYVNSLLNCIIYTIFSPDFRTAFKKILFGHRYNTRYFIR